MITRKVEKSVTTEDCENDSDRGRGTDKDRSRDSKIRQRSSSVRENDLRGKREVFYCRTGTAPKPEPKKDGLSNMRKCEVMIYAGCILTTYNI